MQQIKLYIVQTGREGQLLCLFFYYKYVSMFRKSIFTLLMVGGWALGAWAQHQEVGLGFGTTTFMGDLGKHDSKTSTYFGNVGAGITRPAATIWYRNTFNPWVAIKGSMTFSQIKGDDRLAESTDRTSGDWYRSYRNLRFQSVLIEAMVQGEVHVLRYLPGSLTHRWTPYVSTGIGMVYFDPKTDYNGQLVRLQPLGTEGQGLAQYPDRQKYSLVQAVIPIAMGLKVNINQRITISGEIGHRVTFTDYMDDVSTTYVSQERFEEAYGAAQGQMIYELSHRSGELDPDGAYGAITKPGQYRGNPKGKDSYLCGLISVSFRFGKTNPESAFRPRLKKGNPVVE